MTADGQVGARALLSGTTFCAVDLTRKPSLVVLDAAGKYLDDHASDSPAGNL
jgi:hypothetical protein